VAQWLLPLLRAKERIEQLKPHLLVVQLGRATGTMSAFGPRALELTEVLAEALELGPADPWHAARDRFEELAGWLAMLANALGKIGLDAMIPAQSEIAEIRFEGAGGSSTLPQKHNPVAAETLVSLARHAALMAGGMHQAALAMNERDGVAWSLEWLCLPGLILATGSALERAGQVTKTLQMDAACMRHNLDSMQGLVLAEAATFALAKHVSRPEADQAVKKAVELTMQRGGHLLGHPAAMGDWPVEWSRVRDPLSTLSTARQMAERVLAHARLRVD
jgi:3-carboxy-cis,cis-muconate cycloisomerase